MITLDWTNLGLGVALGLLAAGLFFAGLGLGLRIALRQARPTPVLLFSSALRIAALLGLGAWVAQWGAAALAGFALTFLGVRVALLALVRPVIPAKATP